MSAAVRFDLKPKRDLLDPSFDGYKLSLDPLPTYKKDLSNGLDVAPLTDDQYSYQHVKAFGIHNHLFLDNWNPCTVYFVDKEWNIGSVTVTTDGLIRLHENDSVLRIPNGNDKRLVPGRHNVTMCFPSPEWAVLADGTGMLHLIETGTRCEGHKWKIAFSKAVLGERKTCIVVDSVIHSDNENHWVECLLLHVDEPDESTRETLNSPFLTVLDWVTLTSVDMKNWSLERMRCLHSSRSADFVAFDQNGKFLHIASERPFQMVYDSVKPVEQLPAQGEETLANDRKPEFTWNQDSDSVCVHFTVPEELTKADIHLVLKPDYVDLSVKNRKVLLKGQLYALVDRESSTWTLSERRLDLYLGKSSESMWPILVQGNTSGEMVMDEAQVASVHEQLMNLTSEQWNADPEDNSQKPYNTQQLEDCDAFPDDFAVLVRIDGDTHTATHQANLSSHQWLFNVRVSAAKPKAVCLRHDVDGLLWQPEPGHCSDEHLWNHISTFHALGYVQAGKQQKRFSACSPDCSYAAITDCIRHVYIYRQPSPINSPLRNRKTGRQVTAIAKQQLISLESVDDILGMQATNKFLFVSTARTFHAIHVNTEAGD